MLNSVVQTCSVKVSIYCNIKLMEGATAYGNVQEYHVTFFILIDKIGFWPFNIKRKRTLENPAGETCWKVPSTYDWNIIKGTSTCVSYELWDKNSIDRRRILLLRNRKNWNRHIVVKGSSRSIGANQSRKRNNLNKCPISFSVRDSPKWKVDRIFIYIERRSVTLHRSFVLKLSGVERDHPYNRPIPRSLRTCIKR